MYTPLNNLINLLNVSVSKFQPTCTAYSYSTALKTLKISCYTFRPRNKSLGVTDEFLRNGLRHLPLKSLDLEGYAFGVRHYIYVYYSLELLYLIQKRHIYYIQNLTIGGMKCALAKGGRLQMRIQEFSCHHYWNHLSLQEWNELCQCNRRQETFNL
jgi:hypothetical protein